MAVNWECSKCEAYLTAKKAADDSKEWSEFCDLRESLIWALLVTGFPPKSEWAITEKNWEEVYTRLKALETVSGSYRIYGGFDDHPKRTMWFTPAEVHSMIGLAVNSGNKSPTEWGKWLVKRLKEDSDSALRRYHKDCMDADQAASEIATHP